MGPEKINVTFTASSSPEVISWILSYGEEAELLQPQWLVKEIAEKIDWMHDTYAVHLVRHES
jgi:predicted DNA-binding transcriptional regulator YafY